MGTTPEKKRAYMKEYAKRPEVRARSYAAKKAHAATEKGKATMKVNGKRFRDGRRALIRSLRDRPCHDCGGIFPTCCMEFDHVPERGPKVDAITNLAVRPLPMLMAEVAKCDVVCANCHCIRTEKRRLHAKGQ